MPHGTKDLFDLGEKFSTPTTTNEKFYQTIKIPKDKLKGLEGKDIGDKVALYVVGPIKNIGEDGVSIEMRQAGDVRKLTDEEYLSKSDEEKDEIDEKNLKEKFERRKNK